MFSIADWTCMVFPHCLSSSLAHERESSEIASFPFPTEPDDHCESPKEAYLHIVPLLRKLKSKQQSLRIYDPYYCDGAVKRNFAQLGFPNVYNEKEDCYQAWEKEGTLPSFDVLVSNPPYSGDHIERLIHFVFSPALSGRPWFLLLPQWVHKKDFFLKAMQSRTDACPFYVVPRKRYVYLPPRGFRGAKTSDTHKKSSPFISMWYIFGGTAAINQTLIQTVFDGVSSGEIQECDLARSKSALRDLRRKQR